VNNKIDQIFLKNNDLKLMMHVVAGYPDFETNMKIIKLMSEYGVDLIEIQIPFSDPLADGPTIMKANQLALDKGVKLDDCFQMVRLLKNKIEIPLLFMSYANVPFSIGTRQFISKCASIGISGLIIPDLPFDENNENYIDVTREYNLHPIQVISPDIANKRLKKIADISSGFLYTTLKVGITGASKTIDRKSFAFLKMLKKNTSLPIAAGFGISSPDHIKELKGKTDIAVIGSHILNLLEKDGLEGIKRFIIQCKKIISD
jgi:tryptophan synthase alpha chain